MRRSGRLEQLIAEAHLERSGQTRTLAVDPLTGQADQQRSPGQEQDQGQHAPLQPAWRETRWGCASGFCKASQNSDNASKRASGRGARARANTPSQPTGRSA